jgi:protocatechuate 3,4-dioxygenase beta subunit
MTTRTILIAALLGLAIAGGALLAFRQFSRGDLDRRIAGKTGAGSSAGAPDAPGSRGERGTPGEGAGEERSSSAGGESGSAGSGKAARTGPEASVPGTKEGEGPESGKDASPSMPEGQETPGKGEASLSVVVLDPDGKPFAGVAVEIGVGHRSRTAASGPDGVAGFAELPAGNYEVIVRPPGTPPLRSARPVEVPAEGQFEVRCQIPAFDGEIAGRVLDAAGEPIAGIEIDARPIGFGGSGATFIPDISTSDASPSTATSGEDGSYRFTGLPRIEHSLTTRETGNFPSARAVAIAGSDEPVDITIAARRTLIISGTVEDGSGAPVPGAEVNALTHPAGPAKTDEEGRFRLEVKYERGSIVLGAKKPGYARGEAAIQAGEIGDREEIEMTLRLEPAGTTGDLEGRVVDEAGQPVPGQIVRLHASSINATYQVPSGEDGSFAVRDARTANDYRVWLNPDRGYRDFALTPFAIAEGANRLDIVLKALETGRISGVMVDPSGRPVPRFTLYARSLAATANSLTVTGDDAGRFDIDGVPAGDITFETRAAPIMTIRGVRLGPGESIEVELLVGRGGGRLAGRIVSSEGGPVAGARIILTWTNTRGAVQGIIIREATSDSSGGFLFAGLCRGRGSLTVTAPGYRDHRETREMSEKAEEMPPIEMKKLDR